MTFYLGGSNLGHDVLKGTLCSMTVRTSRYHPMIFVTNRLPYAHTCTPRALVMYYAPIYIGYIILYALVGRAISIRDPYICANESHAVFHRTVVCAVKTLAIGFKTSIEAYFVEKTALRCWSCSRRVNYAITFELSIFKKIGKIKNGSCIATMNPLVSLFCDSNV